MNCVCRYTASQADVAVFKAIPSAPTASANPHSARWYKHIKSYESEFASLPGDSSVSYTTYGPLVASTSAAKAPEPAAAAADDDEDIDLFGSDDEEVDEEAEKLKQQRLAEYAAKKAGKTKVAAKSVVTLDVKPWDDETDMKALEASVRSIEKGLSFCMRAKFGESLNSLLIDGLVWGLSKLVPVGYGVNKLQINLVIEDEKISLDDLQDVRWRAFSLSNFLTFV